MSPRHTAAVRAVALSIIMVAASAAGAEELLEAFRSGNIDQLHLHAHRAGARGLEPKLTGSNRTQRMAATAAAPAAQDAWQLLPPLAALASEPDHRLAADAARSAVTIAERLDRHEVERLGISPEELELFVSSWKTVARVGGRWPDVRVHALVVVSELAAAGGAPVPGYDVVATLADPDPELRRAGLELLPTPPAPAHVGLIRGLLLTDPDPEVALAAAQALCLPLSLGAAPGPTLTALGPEGMARVRELVVRSDAPMGAVVDAARCLRADPARASAKVLQRLRRRGPRALRAAIHRLGKELNTP